jgi:TatD DNase family protein
LDELRIVEDWLRARNFIAIGETGLDFYWDVTFEKEQYAAFHQQIEWCLEFDVPVVVHSRKSTDECINVVKQYPKLRGVFHCFSGTEEQAAQLTELNFLLGIGGVLTFKNSGLDKAIQGIDLKHIILETDAPYLAPVPFRGKRNEPAYLSYVIEKLAALKGREVEEVAAITTENAIKLFNLR